MPHTLINNLLLYPIIFTLIFGLIILFRPAVFYVAIFLCGYITGTRLELCRSRKAVGGLKQDLQLMKMRINERLEKLEEQVEARRREVNKDEEGNEVARVQRARDDETMKAMKEWAGKEVGGVDGGWG